MTDALPPLLELVRLTRQYLLQETPRLAAKPPLAQPLKETPPKRALPPAGKAPPLAKTHAPPAVKEETQAPLPEPAPAVKTTALPHDRSRVTLEPLNAAPADPLDDIRRLVQESCPNLKVESAIPDDGLAKRKRFGWQRAHPLAEILVLVDNREAEPETALLENLCAALTAQFAPCALADAPSIEEAGRWSDYVESGETRLLLATRPLLSRLPLLQNLLKSGNGEALFFGAASVIVLDELSLYLAEPQRKRALWQALCKALT